MNDRRCPNCGGLVGADSEWCTQCFTRLDEGPAPSATEEAGTQAVGEVAPAGPAQPALRPVVSVPVGGQALVRRKGEAIVWDCPACGTENPIEASACSACGTPFGQMLQPTEEKKVVDPGRAATFSLIFPGAGHYVAGLRGEGFARGVIFTFALVMGIASIGPVRSGSGGTYLLLMVISLGAAAALYVTSTADAGRAARGDPQILSMRLLLYAAVGLIFVAILLLTIAATQARG